MWIWNWWIAILGKCTFWSTLNEWTKKTNGWEMNKWINRSPWHRGVSVDHWPASHIAVVDPSSTKPPSHTNWTIDMWRKSSPCRRPCSGTPGSPQPGTAWTRITMLIFFLISSLKTEICHYANFVVTGGIRRFSPAMTKLATGWFWVFGGLNRALVSLS